MTETVYMLGAGINWDIKHPLREVRPPLAKDFFQQLLMDAGPENFSFCVRNRARSMNTSTASGGSRSKSSKAGNST